MRQQEASRAVSSVLRQLPMDFIPIGFRTHRSGSFGVVCRPADMRTRHSSHSAVVKRGRSAASASRSRSDTQVSIAAVHTCVGDGYTSVNRGVNSGKGKSGRGSSQPRLKKRLGQDGGVKTAAFADTTYRDMSRRFSGSFRGRIVPRW